MTNPECKIGVMLCKCGTNIYSAIDFDAVDGWVRKNPRVSAVFSHDLLCSLAGRDFAREAIRSEKLDRVIIAACSPRQHEATFRKVAEEAGANVADILLVNLREHCAWVTPDKAAATRKAIALLQAAIGRAVRHEPLQRRRMDCITDVVVVGGGVAGIEAALLASQAGRKVTIIEKDIALGGRMVQTEELAPNLECAPCLLAPRLSKLKDDPNITVIANATVTGIVGFLGNFAVKVHRRARCVTSSCIGCEACFEACPQSVPSEFHLGLGTRKAIHTLFPGQVPAAAAIDKRHCRHFTGGSCQACVDACPFAAIDFAETDQDLEVPAGAVILATGFTSHDPAGIKRLGYGRIPNVYTLPEFDRLANSNGPLQGKLRCKNGSVPASVAVIHCAGSLSPHGLDYCSGICCLLATKVGEMVRKQNPKAKVYNLHQRLVFGGRAAQHFYQEQAEAGTKFLAVTDLEKIKVTRGQGHIHVSVPGQKTLQVNLVVLATGMGPTADAQRLCELAGIEVAANGFFKPDNPFLHAVGSTLDGIYTAGGCTGPCLVDSAVLQAQAAAGEAVSRLVPGKQIELEFMTSCIDAGLCKGCQLCAGLCAYGAIRYDPEKRVSVVNEALCRGCGTCAAGCPNRAIAARHYLDEQIIAEVEGLLHAEL